jgi:Uma2 family endonuclease
MVSQPQIEHDDTPHEDKVVLLRRATWADYQRLLEVRGEAPTPRLAYLKGVLEIMTPSRPHESLKSKIGCLVEVWCLENGIDFNPYGSWTLERKDEESGIEPDECYVFGTATDPDRPDLAIEVVWTSGGLDKLAIYARLGVREVWFWRRGKLSAHVLSGATYQEVQVSRVLPGIDLTALAGFLDRATASQAIREYRAALRVARG